MGHVRLLLVASLAAFGLIVPGSVGARGAVTQPLIAAVGSATSPDAYQISLKDSTGAAVTHVDTGQYTITVHDYATLHNFHLSGPGLNKKTSVSGKATSTWHVTLKKGTYSYDCDPHKTIMHGSFKVT